MAGCLENVVSAMFWFLVTSKKKSAVVIILLTAFLQNVMERQTSF